MKAIIDADSIMYRAAWRFEPNEGEVVEEIEPIFKQWLISYCQNIVDTVSADQYWFCIGGQNNFRKHISNSYKSNRVKKKPYFYSLAKQILLEEFRALEAHGAEADDLVYSLWLAHKNIDEDVVICSIDKDLKQIPGMFYDYVKEQTYSINEKEAEFNRYSMLLTGDSGDNIKTCKGIGVIKAFKLLKDKSRFGMLRTILEVYTQYYKGKASLKLREVALLTTLRNVL